MPQKGIPVPTVLLPNGTVQLAAGDNAGNEKVTNYAGDVGAVASGPLSAATQVTTVAGTLKSMSNTIAALTTVATSSLTTSQIGAFYDVKLNTASLSALTTAQVAALTTTQLVALALPNQIDQGYGGGTGIPIVNGVAFVPGTGQVGNVVTKNK